MRRWLSFVVPWQHPSAGASCSRRRTRCTQSPASAGRTSNTSPRSGCRPRQQRSIRNHQRLSAPSDPAQSIPGKVAATLNPHSPTRSPRVRSSGAFRRRPPYRIDRSRRAGIRNPKRYRSFAGAQWNREVRPHRIFGTMSMPSAAHQDADTQRMTRGAQRCLTTRAVMTTAPETAFTEQLRPESRSLVPPPMLGAVSRVPLFERKNPD